MKHCPYCGSALDDGAKFCVECGQPLPEDAPVVEAAPAAAPVEPVHAKPAVSDGPAAAAPVPAAAEASQAAPVEMPVITQIPPKKQMLSTFQYILLSLLYGIPVIGLIVMIIMACAAKNKNLKHWTRALLIWILVGLIVSVILGLVAWIIGKNAGIELTNIDFNAIFQSLFDALGV